MSKQHPRPWPVPDGPWLMNQRWHDLLFIHWPLAPETVRPLVPASLPLDTHDGQAWIGVVPFWMSSVRPRLVPPLPGLSRFPELNVRTYVTLDDKPGVYFFSLDAANRIAVLAARHLVGLPYFRARMSVEQHGATIDYTSQRIQHGAPRASFRARYRPTGDLLDDVGPGTLAWWLTARYCLYTVDPTGHPSRLEVDHAPWPLQPAELEVEVNSMTTQFGLTLPDREPLLHYSRRLDVHIWSPRRV